VAEAEVDGTRMIRFINSTASNVLRGAVQRSFQPEIPSFSRSADLVAVVKVGNGFGGRE
jgi:hypothetical protein